MQVEHCGAGIGAVTHTCDFSCNLLSPLGARNLCDLLHVGAFHVNLHTNCCSSQIATQSLFRDALQPFAKIRYLSLADNSEIGGGALTGHATLHVFTSHVTRHTSHVTRHTSHVTRHTSHVTRHTSLVTRHTSHVTRHTSRHNTGMPTLSTAIRLLPTSSEHAAAPTYSFEGLLQLEAFCGENAHLVYCNTVQLLFFKQFVAFALALSTVRSAATFELECVAAL